MKKKYIVISISVILLIGLLIFLTNKNNKEYIMQDGIMLALTLDGEKITSYPEGTNYEVEINCENGKGKWLVDEWKLAVEEVIGNVVCSINFKSNPKTLISEVEEVNVNNNYNGNGYRYSGKQPNNYIWFNNEMWRIIGSIPTWVKVSSENKKLNFVKIIRDQSIGHVAIYALDNNESGYTTEWGNTTIYKLLNSYYYGKRNGTSTSYCYASENVISTLCDFRHVGIDSKGYYGSMIEKVYWNYYQSKSSKTAYESFITEETNITYALGYIGLISASDYGYAADSSYHSTPLGSYNSAEISGSNWLYGPGNEWTLVKQQGSSVNLLYVSIGGDISQTAGDAGHNVRPVVYLDQSVYIISGDGTESNPYQIGM